MVYFFIFQGWHSKTKVIMKSQEPKHLIEWPSGKYCFQFRQCLAFNLCLCFSLNGQSWRLNIAGSKKFYTFRYLGMAFFPLAICYCIYSAIYNEHKGWYSFVLSSTYGFLLTFGKFYKFRLLLYIFTENFKKISNMFL